MHIWICGSALYTKYRNNEFNQHWTHMARRTSRNHVGPFLFI